MNPFGWILVFLIVSKNKHTYEPIVAHLKMILICYINKIAKMDVEITVVLKKMLVLKPVEESKDLNNLNLGKITKEHWSVVYQRKEGQIVLKNMFCLGDKHLYSTPTLNLIPGLTEDCKANTVAAQKCFSAMIK